VVLEGPGLDAFWSHGEDRGRAGGVAQAPVIVLPLVNPGAYLRRYRQADKAGAGRQNPEGWPVPYWWVDSGGALSLLLLGAVEEGLGALFFALHHPPGPLLEQLGVPAGWEPLGAVALGWPTPDWQSSVGSARRGRAPLHQVLHRNQW
jgi:nitroreductase